MKNYKMRKSMLLLICYFSFFPLSVFTQSSETSLANKPFNLTGEHSSETQYFVLESKLFTLAPTGKRVSTDVFKLRLKYEQDNYTCVQFTIKLGKAKEISIPALENYSYTYFDGLDEQNQVFGINHNKFENLKDQNGNVIPQDKMYHVYNAFIDFHAFCNVFPFPTSEGKGVQDLTRIGQKIIHASANSQPPTNLGSNIAEGSFFKNGEITLEFKGLGVVNKKTCALLGIDSGESSFKMIMNLSPEIKITTVGSSHYFGDIYKDLSTNWVKKVTFNEIVVNETTMPMPPNKIHSVVERNILIQNVSRKIFYNF